METTQKKEVSITRVFNAPRKLVFKAWTDPEQLVKWYSPRACTIEFLKIDVRTGGDFHSVIKIPKYKDCWCVGKYIEVIEPEKIVFTMAIADEQGNLLGPIEAGMDPDWPKETTVTVTFAEDNGKTVMTLHQTVSEELAKRTGAYPSWLEMFDRLEEDIAA